MRKRRAVSVFVMVGLLCSVMTNVSAAPEPLPTPPGTPAAAAIPEVVMVCHAGQIDINHATAAEIASGLGLGGPTAQRVVGYRPYLAPSDLSVVEGIGPGKLSSILASDKACATLTAEPPPAAEACTDNRVDLQSASVDELVQALKMPRPVAERLVAARPFASKQHVTPERVAGIGKGTLQDLSARTCLTPAPVRTATTSYRWAYRSQTTTVSRDGFALRVPAGVLDISGAWTSITPASSSPIELEGPTADFHIYGAWEDGAQTVDVTLPIDPDAAAGAPLGYLPTVAHLVPGDTEMYFNTAVTTAGGSVTVQAKSLSTFVSTLLNIALAPLGGTALVSRILEEEVRSFLDLTASQPSCVPPTPSDVMTGGDATTFDSGLERRPLLHCVEDRGPNAEWLVANNSGTVVSIYTGLGDVKVVDAGHTGDPIIDAIFDQWNATSSHNPDSISRVSVDLPPGALARLQVAPGIVEENIPVGTNESLALIAFLLRNFSKLAPAEKVGDVIDVLLNCQFLPNLGYGDLGTALNCVKDFFVAVGSVIAKAAAAFLFVFDAIASLESTIRSESGSPWDLILTHLAPPPPPTGGQPSSGGGASSSPAGRLIVKVSTGPESWVVDQAGVAHPIADGGTYVCNAEVMPVRYNLDPSRFAEFAPGGIGAPATCPNVAPTTIAPGEQYNIAPAILREQDGTAWIVDNTDRRTEIADGSSFNCFAENLLVWDFVSRAEVLSFAPDPGAVIRFCFP